MFYGTKRNLDSSRTDFLKIVQSNFFNAIIKLPMDSKFSNHVKFLGFILDGKHFSQTKSVQLHLHAFECYGRFILS